MPRPDKEQAFCVKVTDKQRLFIRKNIHWACALCTTII